MRVALISLCVMLACITTANAAKPQIKWVPDVKWAGILADSQKGKYTRVKIACMKPVIPKGTAATFNVVQEDCIVIANTKTQVFCGEVAWQDGMMSTEPLDCKAVALSFKRDVKPAWIVIRTFGKSPPVA